jgi:hypothetical protein
VLLGVLGALGVAVLTYIGGVAAPFTVEWIQSRTAKLGMAAFWVPIALWVLVVVVFVGLIVLIAVSVFRRTWRDAFWMRLLSVRPLTADARKALVAEGYKQRDNEVQAERTRSPRPSWRISKDGPPGSDIYFLNNSGWRVHDVRLTADPELFEFDGEAFFSGDFGDNSAGTSTGRQFSGKPTQRGRREGVTFDVTWVDQNGDAQPSVGNGELPNTVELSPEKPKSVVKPTWQVGYSKKDRRILLLLDHTHAQSQVSSVSIEADPIAFTFMGDHSWPDEEFGAGRPFPGAVTEYGHNLGVTFTLS